MMLKLPIDFSAFFPRQMDESGGRGKLARPSFPRIMNEKESIDSFLELLLSSYPGECSFFIDFAFSFWGHHHENFSIEHFNNTEQPRNKMENRLHQVICKYEPRLKDVSVELLLVPKTSEENDKSRDKHIIVINVNGRINNENKDRYHKKFYFDSRDIPRKH